MPTVPRLGDMALPVHWLLRSNLCSAVLERLKAYKAVGILDNSRCLIQLVAV